MRGFHLVFFSLLELFLELRSWLLELLFERLLPESELFDFFEELLLFFLESPVKILATPPKILPIVELRLDCFSTFFVSLDRELRVRMAS